MLRFMKIQKRMRKYFEITLAFLLTLSWGNYAVAGGVNSTTTPLISPPNSSWHFLIAPYAWMSSIDADITVRNTTRHLHLSFIDILERFEIGAQGHVEAGYGPLTLIVDPVYLKISDTKTDGLVHPKITSQSLLLDAGLFYRIFSTTIRNASFFSIELLGGMRHLGLKNTLTFTRIPLTISSDTQLTAPIIGGRLKYNVAKASFWLRGDVGGFHVDHVNSTWSITSGISYTVHSHIDLGMAYRVLDIDASKTNAAANILLYGPMLGMVFHW